MPRINGTRQPAKTEKPKASDKVSKPSTRRASSASSGGEGPSVSSRDTYVPVSSHSCSGEGPCVVTPAPVRPDPIPSRNVWSYGGGGE